ncbi:4-hydroxyphenylacetate catabolism regulatory protein HpaA [Thorsellia kenyensis]|uniref:4-hydroxyphenylacetate catabolism regulatory protein HpaA n=1 Tax=Thorsellia kenyensis TaxID=1549888 RepID=A0ABV6CD37_9GAMM
MKQIPSHIPNLNLVQTYDKFYQSTHIQYESLSNLASYFGRVMHLHRHDQFYQLHFIHHGTVHLQLGFTEYIANAPLIFFTPPPTPHSFVTEPNASGQVLTIHQSVMQNLFDSMSQHNIEFSYAPTCITLHDLPVELKPIYKMLEVAFNGLELEHQLDNHLGNNPALLSWSELIFINLFRLMGNEQSSESSSDLQTELFRKYLALVEETYHQHKTMDYYAKSLNTTTGHLNKLCRMISSSSSKQIIHDRIILEAKYLLSYTNQTIQKIAFELGFQDPAYFTRFFTQNTQLTPKAYRASANFAADTSLKK